MAHLLQLAKLNLGLAPDPKLTFRSNTLSHLCNSPRPIPLSDTDYWSIYTSVFDFPSDVPTLVSAADIRKAVRDRLRNVSNLLRFLVTKLDALANSEAVRRVLEEEDRQDVSMPRKSSSQWRELGMKVPSTIYQGAADLVGVGGGVKTPKGPLKEILNCVRMLTRVLPFVMDNTPSANGPLPQMSPTERTEWSKSSEKADWVQNLLWDDQVSGDKDSTELSGPTTPVVPVAAAQFVIEEDEEQATESTLLNQPSPPVAAHPPLLAMLLSTIPELLFLPGLCVPASPVQPQARYPIWTGGIGCSQLPLDHRQSHNTSKVEILRLLLVVLSQPLYRPPHLYATASSAPLPDSHPLSAVLKTSNPALSYFCTKTSKPILLALLCSLLNTSLAPAKTALISSAQAITTMATGFGKMAQEKIGLSTSPGEPPRRPSLTCVPSSSNLGGASQLASSEGLPSWCAEVLSLLLLPDISSPLPEGNGFRTYVSKLHRTSDLNFIVDHLLAIISRPMGVASNLLQPLSCGMTESVVLLYLILEANPRVLAHLTSSRKSVDLVIALIFICLDQKDSGARPKIGLLRVCGILLQLVSTKALGPLINTPIELPISIRTRYSVPGTLADFLLVSICSIIFSTSKADREEETGFSTVYGSLLITITNVSAHVKNLSLLAAERMGQLLGVLSKPGFLLSEDGNVRLLYYLLEAFNNVIQYQMSDNPHLIYVLLKCQNKFDGLATFTLQDGLRDLTCQQHQRSRGRGPKRRSSEACVSEFRRTSLGSDRGSKGKGKMMEGELTVLPEEERELEESEGSAVGEEVSAESVGRNGFVPTESWVSSWRDGLPLDTIMILATELKPKLPAPLPTPPTPQMLSLLRSSTLLGHLPPPTIPKPRTFALSSLGALSWIASLLWSLVFLRDSSGSGTVGYLSGVGVELFGVRTLSRDPEDAGGRVLGLLRSSFGKRRSSMVLGDGASGTHGGGGVMASTTPQMVVREGFLVDGHRRPSTGI